MVLVEIVATGERFTINHCRIVSGKRELAKVVKELALVVPNPSGGDPDYCIAELLEKYYGCRVIEHDYTDFEPGVVY